MKMAKKEIRVITASAEVSTLVDRGAAVYDQLQGAQSEDKAIKASLQAQVKFETDETSVRLAGNKAQALLSQKTSYGLEFASPEAKAEFEADFAKGVFNGAVSRVVTVALPAGVTLEKLTKALEKLGGTASAEYEVEGKEVASLAKPAAEKIEKVMVKKVTVAVKYEPKA
jgi:hypothetical protein